MSAVNPDDSKPDYSSLVAFSQAYKLVAKKSEDVAEPWRMKVVEAVWRHICRRVRRAGVSEADAEKVAEEILIAAIVRLDKPQDTVAAYTKQLLHFVRMELARRLRQNSRTEPKGPYYVSVAWRQKYDPSGERHP